MSESKIYDLLINTYLLERLSTAVSKDFRTGFTLYHILRYLRARPYITFAQDEDEDKDNADESAYLATHVAYVLNSYGRLRLKRADLPRVYPYLRRIFPAVLKRKDVELVGEVIEVFRATGQDERSDWMVARGTDFLLKTQKPDGSWGPWETKSDPYDGLHYTWCAVLGLRGRGFTRGTAFDRRRQQIPKKLGRRSPRSTSRGSPRPASQPASPPAVRP